MGKHKRPAFKRAEKDAQKGKDRVREAERRAKRARDLLRRKHSVPDAENQD